MKHNYREGSKLEAARAIYSAYEMTLTRKEIIVVFMEQLEMSHNGASSFFHKVKNPEGAKKPTTKLEQAQEIYMISVREGKNRKDTLQYLQDRLFMSESGASTYYYKVRKQLGAM